MTDEYKLTNFPPFVFSMVQCANCNKETESINLDLIVLNGLRCWCCDECRLKIKKEQK